MKSYQLHKPITADINDALKAHDPLVRTLLHNRGIICEQEAADFILPDYATGTHDPRKLKDMDKAVERIMKAIKGGEKIVIYSDYDTDGIPAGVAFHDFFKKIAYKNFYNYIPHRHDEGFGLNNDAIDEFKADGVNLLITIDCGIADVVPVTRARDAGIDVIITDHHMVGDAIPPAYAIVNPKQVDCEYPEKMLCGAGVIFKVIQALVKQPEFAITPGWEKWLLDMIGIATLSDMVPLRGENRVFGLYGLAVLKKSKRPGLITLLRKVGVSQRDLTEDDVGFSIGPRINAASRMGVPMDAFKLLATQDDVEARTYTDHLDKINNQRKGAVAQLVKEVKHELTARYSEQIPAAIVVGNPTWRPSLVGLVANSCAEEFGRPTFIWGRDGDGILKGSCRSGGSSKSVLDVMKNAPEGTFLQYGGHHGAGGFSVSLDKIHTLAEVLAESAKHMLHAPQNDTILIDAVLQLDDISEDTYNYVSKLAPYGKDNPKPLFAFHRITVANLEQFGKTKEHMKISSKSSKGSMKNMISFFAKPKSFSYEPSKGKECTIIGHIEKSTFAGRTELRVRVVDVLDPEISLAAFDGVVK